WNVGLRDTSNSMQEIAPFKIYLWPLLHDYAPCSPRNIACTYHSSINRQDFCEGIFSGISAPFWFFCNAPEA
ncbi:hypothetical protein, partial [Escherichia coli]|uniref:hypothetical protein n=1 Tax=Escherichia coli TaxID=562 RepID=UPI001BC82EF6